MNESARVTMMIGRERGQEARVRGEGREGEEGGKRRRMVGEEVGRVSASSISKVAKKGADRRMGMGMGGVLYWELPPC